MISKIDTMDIETRKKVIRKWENEIGGKWVRKALKKNKVAKYYVDEGEKA